MNYRGLLWWSVAKSRLTLTTPWIVTYQAPLSMGFARQEYWSGLSFPSLGDLPNPGIKPMSPALAGEVFTAEPPCRTDCKFRLSSSPAEALVIHLGARATTVGTLQAVPRSLSWFS